MSVLGWSAIIAAVGWWSYGCYWIGRLNEQRRTDEMRDRATAIIDEYEQRNQRTGR